MYAPPSKPIIPNREQYKELFELNESEFPSLEDIIIRLKKLGIDSDEYRYIRITAADYNVIVEKRITECEYQRLVDRAKENWQKDRQTYSNWIAAEHERLKEINNNLIQPNEDPCPR